MNQKQSFWTDPNGFSIVDALAIVYSGTFIILLLVYIKYPLASIKEVIGYLSPLIYIILSGYFTGQAVQQFKMSGSVSYSPPPTPTQVSQVPVTPIPIPLNQTPTIPNSDSNMSV